MDNPKPRWECRATPSIRHTEPVGERFGVFKAIDTNHYQIVSTTET